MFGCDTAHEKSVVCPPSSRRTHAWRNPTCFGAPCGLSSRKVRGDEGQDAPGPPRGHGTHDLIGCITNFGYIVGIR